LRDVGRGLLEVSLYCMRHVRSGILLAASLANRTIRIFREKLGEVLKYLNRARSVGYPYYRHPLPIRIMHWENVVFLAILLMSGLNIFSAHPALNWGKSSYSGLPPVFEIRGQENDDGVVSGTTRVFGRDFDTTGFLGASRDREGDLTVREFPSWLMIPDSQWLAMARRWHFFFAWLLVANGIAFVTYSILSGHLRRDIIPTRQDLRSIGGSILDHLRLRHASGEAAKRYNVLQRLAYLAVIFFLLPLMILMGLGMSPALDALWPGWVDVFLGRQSVRTVHFVVAWALVLFMFVHVFEVIITGFWNNFRSMVTGYYRVKSEGDHGQRRRAHSARPL
jgi:thiosulfate reductase cytochrome b subunit